MKGMVKMPAKLVPTVSSSASAVLPPTACNHNISLPSPLRTPPGWQVHPSTLLHTAHHVLSYTGDRNMGLDRSVQVPLWLSASLRLRIPANPATVAKTSEKRKVHIIALNMVQSALWDPLFTWVRETPLDRVVGMQQNTASPRVSSGEPRGRRCTASAARGVMNRMEAKPNAMAPQADSALRASPRFRPRPEMTKMPAPKKHNVASSQDHDSRTLYSSALVSLPVVHRAQEITRKWPEHSIVTEHCTQALAAEVTLKVSDR